MQKSVLSFWSRSNLLPYTVSFGRRDTLLQTDFFLLPDAEAGEELVEQFFVIDAPGDFADLFNGIADMGGDIKRVFFYLPLHELIGLL